MFTGIVTDIGTVRGVEQRGDLRLTIGCEYDMSTVALGASIACSGVCLTVTGKGADWFAVDVSGETVARSAPDLWTERARLNLERALKVGDELGGHIVTGHVDGVGEVLSAEPDGDSVSIAVRAPSALAPLIAAKGSITLDGVSLTVNAVEDVADGCVFTINLIPHTGEVTTLGGIAPGRMLNIEIDILARYLGRMREAMTA